MTTIFTQRVRTIIGIMLLTLLLVSLVPAQSTRAAGPWYVATTGDDSNTCQSPSAPCATIQAAIDKGMDGETIYVAVGTYHRADYVPAVVMMDMKALNVSGGWSNDFITSGGLSIIDGEKIRSGFLINGGPVTIDHVLIQNGHDGNSGGGLIVTGVVTINDSVITNNVSDSVGGGVYSSGILNLNRTTVSYNSSGNCCGYQGGSAIYIDNGGLYMSDSLVTGNTGHGSNRSAIRLAFGNGYITNSTISGNTTETGIITDSSLYVRNSTITNNAKGIEREFPGSIWIENSILYGNTDYDCTNATSSFGYNIIGTQDSCINDETDRVGINPDLGSLQNNGGSTLTHALLASSPAIDGGNPTGCSGGFLGVLRADQRGYPRTGRCDIGAYEVSLFDGTKMEATPTTAKQGEPVQYTITIHNGTSSSIDNATITDVLPDLLLFQPGSLEASTGIIQLDDNTIIWSGDINSGASIIVSFIASVSPRALGDTFILNYATLDLNGQIIPVSASIKIPLSVAFLPLVHKQIPGLSGHVTFNGANAANVTLKLYLYNGVSWVQFRSGWTDPLGMYSFTGLPGLSSGQKYAVDFINPSDAYDNRLFLWETRHLENYNDSQSLTLENFDLADALLLAPANNSTHILPVTFEWNKRIATPDDSYQFVLYSLSGSVDYESPLLGYVDSYTLTELPAGFTTGEIYGWTIWINSPDGGIGVPYYYGQVSFSNNGSVSAANLDSQFERATINNISLLHNHSIR